MGPADGGGGLQHMSGDAAVDFPSEALQQISLSFANTPVVMMNSFLSLLAPAFKPLACAPVLDTA